MSKRKRGKVVNVFDYGGDDDIEAVFAEGGENGRTDQPVVQQSDAAMGGARCATANQPPTEDLPDTNTRVKRGRTEQTCHDNVVEEAGGVTAAAEPQRPAERFPEETVAAAKAVLGRRLMLRDAEALDTVQLRPAAQDLRDRIHVLLEATVVSGHNNSLLLIGPRGCGKSLLLDMALRKLCLRHNTAASSPTVGVVRLNRLLHTEDRAAFQEIARQLCSTFHCTFAKTATYGDNLDFLRDMLKELRRGHKSVVFVLEEFDAFGRRSKQTMLYNLLDLLQCCSIQAAVIGVTCRHDVLDLMEKRVRSRFSYRKFLVPGLARPGAAGEPGDTTEGLLQAMLQLPAGFPDAAFRQQFHASVCRALQSPEWRAATQLAEHCGLTPRKLSHVVLALLAELGGCRRQLPDGQLLSDLLRSQAGIMPPQVLLMSRMSVLDLQLLIALYKLEAKGKSAPTFKMLLQQYRQLSSGGVRFCTPVVQSSLRQLLDTSIVAHSDPRAAAKGGLMENWGLELRVSRSEILEALQRHKNCPMHLQHCLTSAPVSGM